MSSCFDKETFRGATQWQEHILIFKTKKVLGPSLHHKEFPILTPLISYPSPLINLHLSLEVSVRDSNSVAQTAHYVHNMI